MSSAYMATMPTLQIRNSAGTAMWIHSGAGEGGQHGRERQHDQQVTARSAGPRQPASVSSCLTQSRFLSGSRNAEREQHLPARAGIAGEPGHRVSP